MTDSNTRTIHQEAPSECITLRKYMLRHPNGETQSIERRLIYLGSAPDGEVVIDDSTVSRVHCKIEVDRHGHRIRDLESKNGTFINGIRISDAYLPADCTLKIGESEFGFQLGSESVEVQLATGNQFGEILGESLVMREIFALLSRVAPTDITVLVEGESGTGKELVAEALHHQSGRNKGPLVVFDCSAVPRDLVESELFGHVKGSFTGATGNRIGAFEEANGGTLFLDEIGELPLDLQPKLLRVLEKLEIKPVGSNNRIKVDCRIVAATNRDLIQEVADGNFREDLFYRLAVIKVKLPALKNRVEDIPLLVNHFIARTRQRVPGGSEFQISYETMAKLQKHPWPGNIRELKNFVERAAILAGDGDIDTRFIGGNAAGALSGGIVATAKAAANLGHGHSVQGANTSTGAISVDYKLPFKDAKNRLIDEFERVYWTRLLSKSDGNISEAARLGGIHRKSLEYLLKKIGVTPK
ncbi:MAG TPA: FHA domain-containing protein [Myxococcales bacterium]|nr:FHA domain-containing protein [Myxococcales bacterium]HIN86864.1 FHA domain-containing protein [Myxococcales bacterium]